MIKSALIIGGGIGGLATAIALKRIGVEATVFESSPELREVGAGLTLWSNGMYALDKIGVADSALKAGMVVKDFRILNAKGEILGEIDLARVEAKMEFPNVSIHRLKLIEALKSHLDLDSIHLHKRFVSYKDEGPRVTAHFADGSTASGDVLLGCDGFHSIVRQQMLGKKDPRYAGYTCWRGVAKMQPGLIPEGAVWHFMGPGKVFGALDVGHGKLAWYAIANVPAGIKEGPEERRRDMMSRFSNWPVTVLSILNATADTDYLKNDIYDRTPIKVWAKERVLLMGDAAHPTTPNLGQGACQALEDAATFGHFVKNTVDYATAFNNFQLRRVNHCRYVVSASKRAGDFSKSENPLIGSVIDLITKQILKVGITPEMNMTMNHKCF